VSGIIGVPILVITILLLFGIGRRLQKRKSALVLSRSEEIKLEKKDDNFRMWNMGNWIVFGTLLLELLQVYFLTASFSPSSTRNLLSHNNTVFSFIIHIYVKIRLLTMIFLLNDKPNFFFFDFLFVKCSYR
jgi:hypothetical protein